MSGSISKTHITRASTINNIDYLAAKEDLETRIRHHRPQQCYAMLHSRTGASVATQTSAVQQPKDNPVEQDINATEFVQIVRSDDVQILNDFTR